MYLRIACIKNFLVLVICVSVSSSATLQTQAALADNMLRNIPQRAREIFEGDRFGGGELVCLENALARPSYKDFLSECFFCGGWGHIVALS